MTKLCFVGSNVLQQNVFSFPTFGNSTQRRSLNKGTISFEKGWTQTGVIHVISIQRMWDLYKNPCYLPFTIDFQWERFFPQWISPIVIMRACLKVLHVGCNNLWLR